MKVLKYTNLEVQLKLFIITKGCLVNQCLRTFSTRIVEAVLTIVYSFARCSLELNSMALLLAAAAWVETDPPPILRKSNV